MKLTRLYSNEPRLFEPIAFNGVRDAKISVVFASVTKPKDATKDSHNLGKTTLLHLIDFLLLKNIEKDHIFLRHSGLFAKLVFFLELQTSTGQYVTVKETSSQSEGTSYKKVLCALFDLAILRSYSKEHFYHFVYHDGILEGLDVRKRQLVLEVLRESSRRYGIQCIISVIDSDLPRSQSDAKIPFPEDEIILELSDSGQRGRLFKMPEF
jgi:uncharacterized protein YydD (DUF2326 family)